MGAQLEDGGIDGRGREGREEGWSLGLGFSIASRLSNNQGSIEAVMMMMMMAMMAMMMMMSE